MRRFSIPDFLPLMSVGLMLTACGGAYDGVSPAAEPVDDEASAGLSGDALPPAAGGASLTAPVASLSCSRPPGGDVTCTAGVTGGVAPYTYFWGERIYVYETKRYYYSSMMEGGETRGFGCYEPTGPYPAFSATSPRLYVRDAAGAQSSTVTYSGLFSCE